MSAKNKNGWASEYIFFIIFIFLASGIMTAGYFYYKNYEKNFRAELEKQLSSIAELKAIWLTQWRGERIADGYLVSKDRSIIELLRCYQKRSDDAAARRQIQTWVETFRTLNRYGRVRIMDTKGMTIFTTPSGGTKTSDTLVKNIPDILKSGKVMLQDFFRHDQDNKIYITVMAPIIDEEDNNRTLGFIALRTDPTTYLYPFIQRWPTPSKSAETLIVRKDENDALFLNDPRFKKDAALNLRIPLTKTEVPAVKAVLGEIGIIEGFDYRGIKTIADIRPIPDSPWFIVSKMDNSEVYGPLRERLWILIAFVGVLLFGARISLSFALRQREIRFYAESEKKYRLLFQNLTSAFALHEIILNNDGIPCNYRFVEVNPAFELLTGLKAESLIGKTVLEAMPGTELHWIENYGRVALSGQPIHFENYSSVLDKYYEIRAYSPEPGRFATVFQDITNRKKAEEEIKKFNATLEKKVAERTAQLDASNKELEAFAYSVSHDLRSPLRAIEGFSGFLLEDYYDKLDEEGKRLLSVIQTNTKKMDQLITDLLHLSRVTRSEINFSVIDMKNLANMVYSEAAAPEILQQFNFSIGPIKEAFGDSALIRQVWFNLISNAIKYTMKSAIKKIEVGGYDDIENKCFVYFVKDTGAGFNPEYTGKLFGVFQRLHKTEEFEGNGVGLALVQRVINRHGGRVWAEGKLGEGAAFYFSIPNKETDQ